MIAALESRAEDLAFGTIAHSLDQYRSKLKCWQSFCELTGAQIIPALEADVIRYVTIFRNPTLRRATSRPCVGHTTSAA